ncbi:hypothetical protein LDENG_00213220 [Lucifuga dentata]|nr:hypothetical protein LDENG_00213220 [Lucifuga dentata]
MLSVIFDGDLSFNRQVNSVVRSSFFQLRAISKIWHFLSPSNLERLIHALISSRLDYCNSLYHGISQAAISCLQLIQNVAARLLTRSKKRDHIIPMLASLHWLPIHFTINFKILLIVYKSLHGLAPISLNFLPFTEPQDPQIHPLWHVGCAPFIEKKAGNRAFSIAAPRLWNSLPEAIRQAESVDAFKRYLKTHFYSLFSVSILCILLIVFNLSFPFLSDSPGFKLCLNMSLF